VLNFEVRIGEVREYSLSSWDGTVAGKEKARFNGQSTCVKDLKYRGSISFKEVKRLFTVFDNIALIIAEAE